MPSVTSSVLAGLDACRPWIEDLYRDVHRHPELSRQEHRTTGLAAERLRGAGYEVHDGVGGTGVVGCWPTATVRWCCCARTWTCCPSAR